MKKRNKVVQDQCCRQEWAVNYSIEISLLCNDPQEHNFGGKIISKFYCKEDRSAGDIIVVVDYSKS